MTSIVFALAKLLDGFVSPSVAEQLSGQISGLAWDSRQVKSGDLFFATAGENIHGKTFISQAINAGAAAIALETSDESEAEKFQQQYHIPVIAVSHLSQKLGKIAARFYAYPSEKFSLIGITGTNGKTSCSHLLAQCLNDNKHRSAVIGTMGAGVWGHLKSVQNTTPGALELQQWFHQLVQQKAKYVAMEVSSHGIEQGRINGCAFDMAVFTNLTQDHLDYHGDMQSYAQVKLKLFTSEDLSSVVLNLDDPFSDTIIEHVAKGVDIVGITLDPQKQNIPGINVFYGQVVKLSNQGMTISVKSSVGNAVFQTSLLGDFNASNLLTVFACAIELGFGFEDVAKKMQCLQAPAGRLERFGGENDPMVVVDYAHTPDALEKVLHTLRKHTVGKLMVLMGCGGDRDKTKRSQMGAVAEKHADVVWLTNDNPRSESPQAIIEDILTGIKDPSRIHVLLDRAEAIKSVVESATAEDVVLIAGKGHEDYQLIGDQRLAFSDRQIVSELFGEAA